MTFHFCARTVDLSSCILQFKPSQFSVLNDNKSDFTLKSLNRFNKTSDVVSATPVEVLTPAKTYFAENFSSGSFFFMK